ncbi:hypothetical protein FB45DRAFT_917225 [Roridomyces roridus]|uniref:Methyltransferase type 11 domain-containing protein n=1 Tax=Roridomyces roridus TaxID=1738132 RepID=A0AAD7BUI0_9AGAR|nr:hypothetical protein FB45DRAFT_917225 [Roridomyces roridus]
MLLQHPSLTGITSLPNHHKRSLARVACLDQHIPVDLYLGDAIYRPGCEDGHPLDPSSKAEFDSVLALDCAYHFNTRWTFLRQVHDQLRPGGSVALADICLARETTWTRFILLPVMPRENLVSTDEYLAHMQRIGYTDVRLEDITPHVFPGFISFLGKQGVVFRIFGSVMRLLAICGARFVIVRGCK